MRDENARVSLEKKTAVRAFWAATSQLKRVAPGVRMVPRMAGAVFGNPGWLTTVMKVCAAFPRGKRMPARVILARADAWESIVATSFAVSRGWPWSLPLTGSAMMGARISQVCPPKTPVG